MKLEMGESLFYSWLRHVKRCQLVQINWKPSPSWPLRHEEELLAFKRLTEEHFQTRYDVVVYKNNSLPRLLRQAEIDAIGMSTTGSGVKMFAVDVAYHESGLNYGSRGETASRIVKKFLRTAMCLRGYFGESAGELIFASPKIHNSVIKDIEPAVSDLNALFVKAGLGFSARIVANEDFNNDVLMPTLQTSGGVADTSELFLRGYQLLKMFAIRC